MSNGSPPTTIEGWPRLSTGRIGLVPPNVAAHIYQPNAPTGLLPPLTEDELENYPSFSTNGVGVAPDAGVWLYQPNVPYGMIEVIPSLQPPTNTTLPLLSYVTGSPAGTVGAIYQCTVGSWTPTTPIPTYVRRWFRDGVQFLEQSAATYTIAAADVGHVITAGIIATNPAGSSAIAMAVASVGPIPDPGAAEEARMDDNGGPRHVRHHPKPTPPSRAVKKKR